MERVEGPMTAKDVLFTLFFSIVIISWGIVFLTWQLIWHSLAFVSLWVCLGYNALKRVLFATAYRLRGWL